MDFLNYINLTAEQFIAAFLGAYILGVSKAGVKGIAVLIVTLMAFAFGARSSTGTLIPLLITGDIFAIFYYNRHTKWVYLRRFLPWMMLGVLIGAFIGKDLPERLFQITMALIILITVVMLWWWGKKDRKVPTHWSFAGFTGTLAGITTMIGNLAGAFSNIFFLAMKLPKNEFIGTAAWLFFFINLFKLPFHIFVWKTVTVETFEVYLYLLPAVIAGLLSGLFLVKKFSDRFFKQLILLLTAIGAVLLFFK